MRGHAKVITVDGVSRSVREWSEHSGISVGVINERMRRRGWSGEDAVTVAVAGDRPDEPRFELDDRCQRFVAAHPDGGTLEEVGAYFGVTRERIRQIEVKALARLRRECARRGIDVAELVAHFASQERRRPAGPAMVAARVGQAAPELPPRRVGRPCESDSRWSTGALGRGRPLEVEEPDPWSAAGLALDAATRAYEAGATRLARLVIEDPASIEGLADVIDLDEVRKERAMESSTVMIEGREWSYAEIAAHTELTTKAVRLRVDRGVTGAALLEPKKSSPRSKSLPAKPKKPAVDEPLERIARKHAPHAVKSVAQEAREVLEGPTRTSVGEDVRALLQSFDPVDVLRGLGWSVTEVATSTRSRLLAIEAPST